MGCVVPARSTRVGSASGRGTSLRRVGWWCLGRRAFRAHRASRFPRLAAATKDRRTRGPAKPCWALGLPRWRHPPSGRRAMLPTTAGCGAAWPSPPHRTKPRPRVVRRCKGCSVGAGCWIGTSPGWLARVRRSRAGSVRHSRPRATMGSRLAAMRAG